MMRRKPSPSVSRLYARYLTPDEKKSLRACSSDGISSEINLVRVLNAHFIELQQSAPQDFGSRIQALHTCSILNEQLAKLVRAHGQEHDPTDEWFELLLQAMREANASQHVVF